MVDVREAARMSRRTPETIRRWVWTGRLAAVKNGNKLFVRRADVAVAAAPAPDSRSSLSEWAERLPRTGGGSGVSAANLVLEDRDLRADR